MRRVIIADDSSTARMFIKRCLEIAGLNETTFVEAANGKEALVKLKEEHADMLVTDLNMPVMDGETLLKWVKSDPHTHEIPVLIITSAGNQARESRLISLGAFAVIKKPVSPANMLTILKTVMNEKGECYESISKK